MPEPRFNYQSINGDQNIVNSPGASIHQAASDEARVFRRVAQIVDEKLDLFPFSEDESHAVRADLATLRSAADSGRTRSPAAIEAGRRVGGLAWQLILGAGGNALWETFKLAVGLS
ncbi:hypothetical protein [Actinophytocola oryzae]|uniref:Uncharacterized protein n=1 Tax=Actinophytocola oryzae TaxID=502181 RepID=A0A4R7VYM6_9PSEU|nr:hypothetical protein [Actinophytocola oryzae]TDV55174.1 hypothetical protein CLV71_103415 [Actinophytocola oryzae]